LIFNYKDIYQAVLAWLYCRHTGVFAVRVAGAPTIVAPADAHVVVALVAVDMMTYLTPSKFELDAGRVTAKDAPAVPVKYVLTFISVVEVSALFATTVGVWFKANKAGTSKLTVLPAALVPNIFDVVLGVSVI